MLYALCQSHAGERERSEHDQEDNSIARQRCEPRVRNEPGQPITGPRAKIERGKCRSSPSDDRQGFGNESFPCRIDSRRQDHNNGKQVDDRVVETHCFSLSRRDRPCSAPASESSSPMSRTCTKVSAAASLLVPAATTAVEKPSFAASFIRNSACGAGRTSPERLISPKKTLSFGKG